MRTRAYRPEVPGSLEDRCLLSGAVGLSAAPVVLSGRVFNTVVRQIPVDFLLYSRNHNISRLRDQLYEVSTFIPFARADGLGESINGILNEMQQDLVARVPHAIRSARNEVIAVTRADVAARIQAGDVIVR